MNLSCLHGNGRLSSLELQKHSDGVFRLWNGILSIV
jgi:hypothetical protein